jgi:uncharacterized protein (TIGR02466 family)
MIHNIFATPIYKVRYEDDLSDIEQRIRDLFAEFESPIAENNVNLMRAGSVSCAQVLEDLHKDTSFKKVIDFYHHHAEIFWKEIGYDQKRPPRLRMMWANIYPPGSYIDSHDHCPMPISGSFYVKKTANSSNIIFEHPLEIILKHQPIAGVRDRQKYFQFVEQEVVVEQGDLVLFPSYLRHKTRPFNDTEDRIIIGGILEQDFRTRINDRL